MSTTGEHPAVPEATTKGVHHEVMAFAKAVLGSQALATLLLMGLAVVGYRALAAESHDAGVQAVAPIRDEVERLKAQLAEQAKDGAESKRRIERVEAVSVDTNANVKIIMARMGLQPVTPEPAKDGGR